MKQFTMTLARPDEYSIIQARAEIERRRRLRINEQAPDMDDSSLLAWTLARRQNLSKGRPFNIDQHLCLMGIYEDDYKQVLYCKAGQVGISEYLISWSLWSADKRACNVLYVLPNNSLVSDFSSARIGSATAKDVSLYLYSVTTRGEVITGKSAVDRVGLKRIRDRYFYLRGAVVRPDGKAPQLRSVDVDCLVLDEYDEMPVAAPPLAEERLGHSTVGEKRIASTPTYPTTGIWKRLIEESDYRRWYVACPHCGNKQTLELTDMIIESDDLDRPVAWHKDDQGPYLACRKCGKKLDRLVKGEWVAEYPGRPWHGYHISRLFTPQKPLQEIVDGLQTLEENKRKEVYNQSLALPYRSKLSMSLTPDVLDRCIRNYGIPGAATSSYMGVDVGKAMHVIIREKGKLIFAGTVSEITELKELMTRFHVLSCVIDALPETRMSRDFQKMFPAGVVWVAYYNELSKDEPTEKWDVKELAVTADRTRTLDTTLAGFRSAAAGSPGNTLPGNIKSISDYYQHLTALERVLKKDSKGNYVAQYVGDPDHYAHAENYCSIASRCPFASGWSRGSA